MKKLILTYLLFLFWAISPGQCPLLLNTDLDFTSDPYWVYCGGTNYTLTLQTNIYVGDFTVDWGDGSPIEVGTGFDAGDINVTHLYTAVTDTFILIFTPDPVAFPGCEINGVVVMEERTTAEIGIPGGIDLSICAPGIFSYVNNSNQTSMKPISETTIFTWDFGDGSPPVSFDYTNAGQTVSHEYLPNTTGCGIFVELTAANYCGSTTALFGPINIWDLDTADITPSATVLCYPDTIFTFFNTTHMNCQPENSAQRYEYWNLGDYWGLGYDSIIPWSPWPPGPNWTLGFPGPGAYTVMLLDSSYCGIDTTYETVIITVPPKVEVTVFPDTICVGESAQFNGVILENFPDYFAWNFGDGSGWQNLNAGIHNHTYMSAGNFTILFVGTVSAASSGCSDTASVQLHVQPSPIPDINVTATDGCDFLVVIFTDNSSPDAVTWDWDFDNGNISDVQYPPTQNYNVPGVYNVTLGVTSVNGCANTTTEVITVWESPMANFSVDNVCLNDTAEFNDLSTFPSNDTIISWNWNFGDGNTSNEQYPLHVYTGAGPINVILVVNTAHCSDSIVIELVVEPNPNPSFYPTPDEGCSPLNVDFTNTTTGAVVYHWDFGDGYESILDDPDHEFINIGLIDTIYTVELIAETTFGCKDTVYDQILVYPGSISDFTVGPVPDCAPTEVFFSNNSINGFFYEWNFGDGSPISNDIDVPHLFTNNTLFVANYTITLVVASGNGCPDTSYQIIAVNPELILDISMDSIIGCSPLTVQFPQSAEFGAISWSWSFNDGATSNQQSPTHVYVNNTLDVFQYEATLIAMNAFGCIDTATFDITVNPIPIANFSATPLTQNYPETTISIFDLTLGYDVYYLWQFGDGGFTTNPDIDEYTYGNWGTYLIQLDVIAKGCTSSHSQTIEILPPEPISDFSANDNGCVPLIVEFVNNSLYADSYFWDFGDGAQSSEEHPTYMYNEVGIYSVKLTAFGPGGQNTIINVGLINVYPNAIAFFTPSTDLVYAPNDPITFYNLSEEATIYYWEFGDGETSDTETPIYYYSEAGIYTVTLTANNEYDCPDVYVAENIVEAIEGGEIEFPNAFTPNPYYSSGGTYDPTDPSQNLNDVFHPKYSGILDYQLWIYNRWGELIFESDDILIGWDGYYKGQLSKQDVYVWKVTAVTTHNKVIKKMGDVTLVR